MFGKITQFAIEVNRITVLVLIGIPILGFLIFLDYPRQEDPSIEIREAIVVTAFPGKNVFEIEELVTLPVEEKIREIGEVDDIWSYSKDGVSIVHVDLADWVPGADIPNIWTTLRNRMSDLESELPAGTIGPAVNDTFGLTAVATIAIWADGWSLEDMRRVARDTRRDLDSLRGVERIDTFGVQPERVFIEIANARIAELGISPGVIIETLRAQNILLPGGQVNAYGRNVRVEASGAFENAEQIGATLIPLGDTGATVPLRDIATVVRDFADPAERPVLFNGRPAIVLSVSILDGVNSVEFGQRLSQRLEEIESQLPLGFVIEFATFQPSLVQAAVNGAISNLGQTLVIVLVVVILFLGLRPGLIVGSFVPVTMLLGLIGMSVLDVELQRMSIATMIIALGMMVDSAIVVAENIRNRIEAGEDRKEAAIAAGRMLGVPLLTSTLTTILAFMPIALAIGSVGEYTISIGQVVILVLLGSWFMSLYMTPTMSYWFLKAAPPAAASEPVRDPYDTAVFRAYRGFLTVLLRFRLATIVVVLAAAVAIGYGARFVKQEFFPANDRNQYLVYLDLEAGAHIDETRAVVEELSAWLVDKTVNPEITRTVGYVGSGGPRFFLSLAPINPDPHVAFVLVETETNDQIPEMITRTRRFIDETFPQARGEVKAMWLGTDETGLVQVRLSGSDADRLLGSADRLMAAFRAVPGTIHVKQDWQNEVLKVRIRVDQARARRAGVTTADISRSLSAFLDGSTVTDFRDGDAIIPVVLRGIETERTQLANLDAITVHSSRDGRNVPMSQVAEIETVWEPYFINRRNLERTVTVSANHPTLKAGELLASVMPTLDALDLPPGYRWEVGGELESAETAQGHLFANFPLALALIVLLLVLQFNSMRRAGIVLLTIPLAFLGAIVGLLVTATPFGFMTLLGLLSLAGIIINNGIIMIDSIEAERAAGRTPYDALVFASISRLRPIAMTTVTTLLGLLPLIIWQDPLFYSMAIVISFGLALGTVLTLGVVPVLYSLMMRVTPPRA